MWDLFPNSSGSRFGGSSARKGLVLNFCPQKSPRFLLDSHGCFFGLPDFETSTDTEEFTELSKMFSLNGMSGEDHITFRSDKTGGG